jgi:hypothetical protein
MPFLAFMGAFETSYNRNSYTKVELLEIKPKNIAKFMKQKAYHTPDPGPNDRSIYCRWSTLVQFKKGSPTLCPNVAIQRTFEQTMEIQQDHKRLMASKVW